MAKKNANAALILSFLYKCVDVFTCYFKDLEEESVRDNFVVIYELLDEMMDFGYPQVICKARSHLESTSCEVLRLELFCEFVPLILLVFRQRSRRFCKSTLRRRLINWKSLQDHQWLSQMPSHGVRKGSNIARMKSFWMLSRV